ATAAGAPVRGPDLAVPGPGPQSAGLGRATFRPAALLCAGRGAVARAHRVHDAPGHTARARRTPALSVRGSGLRRVLHAQSVAARATGRPRLRLDGSLRR